MKMQIGMTLLAELNSAHLVTKKYELGKPPRRQPSLRHYGTHGFDISALIIECDVCFSKSAAENAEMLSIPLSWNLFVLFWKKKKKNNSFDLNLFVINIPQSGLHIPRRYEMILGGILRGQMNIFLYVNNYIFLLKITSY